MSKDLIWNEVDEYIVDQLLPYDPTLEKVLKMNRNAGLPEIDVTPTQGKLLYLLAKMKGVKHILEIGTLGGYSTIWLARALTDGGKVYTLEIDKENAKIAKQNIQEAGFQNKIEVIEGNALDTLPTLKASNHLFDLIFIDADKPNNPNYLKWAIELAKPGTVIIADNVIRDGKVVEEDSKNEQVQGIRIFMSMLKNEPRIDSTAIQTVGTKGYDGFVIGIVK